MIHISKDYVFYEADDEYIPLKITLLDVPGYYNIFNDDSKTTDFKLYNDSLGKTIDIFEHIGEILNIDFYHYCTTVIMGSHILEQKYLMKEFLEKTRIKQLIQFQMKRLSIIVEYYYK